MRVDQQPNAKPTEVLGFCAPRKASVPYVVDWLQSIKHIFFVFLPDMMLV